MADDEFNIDELISGADELVKDEMQAHTDNTNNTVDTSTTSNTSVSLHPFSVRLDEEYVELIKAMAWWKRISQREFIEQILDQFLNDVDSEQLDDIITKFKKNS